MLQRLFYGFIGFKDLKLIGLWPNCLIKQTHINFIDGFKQVNKIKKKL